MNFKVRIHCATYNHSAFIEDAMNGFTTQKTDFPFVAVVMDDASTDGEQDIILSYLHDNFKMGEDPNYFERDEEYAKILFAQHKENENCFFAVYLSKYNHYSINKNRQPYFEEWKSEYVAFCEGDDYWISPLKLQMQVDFLDMNPECGLVRTNVNRLNQKTRVVEEQFFNGTKIKDTHLDYIYRSWWVAPCTWVLRERLHEQAVNEAEKIRQIGGFGGDLAIILYSSLHSKIKYMEEVTAVYRILEKSASHFVDKKGFKNFINKVYTTRRWYAEKQSLPVRVILEMHIGFNRIYMVMLDMVSPSIRSKIKKVLRVNR